jgi:hypothetical protein
VSCLSWADNIIVTTWNIEHLGPASHVLVLSLQELK